MALSDLNGDGVLDLVTASPGGWPAGETLSVLFGRGDGSFWNPVHYTVGLRPEALAVGDVNGDGVLDLVSANSDGDSVSVLLGRGDGTFAECVDYGTGQNPSALALSDLNGDGIVDLVATGSSPIPTRLVSCYLVMATAHLPTH